jgi:uncharacterized protein
MQTFPRFSTPVCAVAVLLSGIVMGAEVGPRLATTPARSIFTLGVAVTENFDAPNSLGTGVLSTTLSTPTPSGWGFVETGTNANTTYRVHNGGLNTGDTYSFGVDGSNERALGGLRSGSLIPVIGACFVNSTGSTISALQISYNGEHWRRGFAGRDDRLDFEYQVGAVALDAGGTWTGVSSLSYTAPSGTTVGALGGTQTAISGSITGLSISNGANFCIRWIDFDATNADDGLAIDDFSMTATGTVIGPVTLSDTPLSAATVGVPYSSAAIVATSGSGCTFSVSPSNALIGAGFTSTSSTDTTFSFSGIPNTAGTVNFTLNVNCTVGGQNSRAYSVTVNPPPPSCGALGRTFIGTLQGTGTTGSASNIEVEGIVVGDYQLTTQLGGFFLQDADGDNDGNAATSDGVFVVANSSLFNVSEGQRVRVRGTYVEATGSPSFGRARVTPSGAGDLLVCPTQTGSVTPVQISLPINDNAALSNEGFERFEGMLVQITNSDLVVTGNNDLGRFGGFEVAPQRLITYTQNNIPSAAGYSAFLDDYFRRIITIDDGSESSSLYTESTSPAPFPTGGLNATNTLRTGSTVSGTLRGVVDFSFSKWRLQPVAGTAITFNLAPRPAASDVRTQVAGRIRIGFGNVLNYFNGPTYPGVGARGAENADDFSRQRTKIINSIIALDPSVYGVSELENDGFLSTSAIQDLVNGLNAVAGPGVYAFIDLGVTPVPADNAITNGILYRTDRVTPVGSPGLRSPVVGGTRATIAQRFRPLGLKASIQEFTVAVVHFKSKGCGGASGLNLDQGDGQSCFNADRVATANDVRQWLLGATSPVGDPAAPANRRIVIVGDYNAYAQEDPILTFEQGGYVNLLKIFNGPSYYSYQFDELFGALDHAMATSAFARLVSGATEWHSNADEPSDLDFNTDFGGPDTTIKKPTGYLSTNEYRTSDHDPLLIGFNPLAGDFDDDGDVDTADQTAIRAQLNRLVSAGADRRMDFDGDGRITLTDYTLWVGAYRSYVNAPN